MEIFILRHGDANSDSKKITDDSKRSLTEAGIKEIENVCRFFEEFDIKIDHIFSSPLKRAKQTAQIILKDQRAKMTEIEELKPEGNPDDTCKKIIKQNHSSILVVGHNPLLVDIINHITSSQKQIASNISLKTGGLAKIKITSVEPRLTGHLEWLLAPKIIRKVSK
jgi:phosphohistidine phosphatase SixA